MGKIKFKRINYTRLRQIHFENAFEKAKKDLDLLSLITNAIMRSLETEQVLYTILTALTSHDGLGFNRALYFEVNENKLQGKMGLGPYTLKEAEEIWRFIEGSSITLQDLFDYYDTFKKEIPSELDRRTKSISIPLKKSEGVLALTALKGMPFKVRTSSAKLKTNKTLKKLLNLDMFVTVPLKTKNRVIGVILADKLFSNSPISNDTIRILNIFADHAAVAIENSILYKKTEHLSRTDHLTGLWNTRHFNTLINEKLYFCLKENRPLNLLMIDIDNFKDFNDTYGHVAGDKIIKKMGSLLSNFCRKNDYACRYGGEEFSFLMFDKTKQQALRTAETLRRTAEELFRSTAKSGITLSIGVAEFPSDEINKQELIRKADIALYHAKETGKNKVCGYCPEMEQ